MKVSIEFFDFGFSLKSKNNIELRGRHGTETVSRKIFSPRDRVQSIPFLNRIIHNHKIGWKKNQKYFQTFFSNVLNW